MGAGTRGGAALGKGEGVGGGHGPQEPADPMLGCPSPFSVTSELLFCKLGLKITLPLLEVMLVGCVPSIGSVFGKQHLHYIMVVKEL